MSEYAASPSCVKSHLWRSSFHANRTAYLPLNSHPTTPQRNYARGACSVARKGSSVWEPVRFLSVKAHGRRSSVKYSFLGSLVDADGGAVLDLITVSDQLLLTASIFLTYMAGVIPVSKSGSTSSQQYAIDGNVGSESSKASGRKTNECVNLESTWETTKAKLLGSLDALKCGVDVESKVFELKQQYTKCPLSLYAISEGPKLRLLLACLQQLELEVTNALGGSEAIKIDDWLIAFPEIIQNCSALVCKAWLIEELHLEDNVFDKALLSLMVEKVNGDETILRNIRKSGKEVLYAEILYFLRFGSSRNSCFYDDALYLMHGNCILEDLVITIADVIAGTYLELISVDSNFSNEINSLGVLCNLSTRALQRLRNEVALNQWLYQNVEAVISMFEDRFDLCVLKLKIIDKRTQDRNESHSWWTKLTQRDTETFVSSLSCTYLSQISLPVKRTKELRALTGWRYYYSLYLELSDIATPLVKAIMEKVSGAISFFLVSLIGRSLGLIYSGIRQSLRWK